MEYLIGIDVGTTGIKTLIMDKDGNVKSSATEDYPLYVPKPNWAEQNPQDWYESLIKSIRAALVSSGVKSEEIRGIGLTGQMHGSVFLDKNHNVLRPCILWCDQRTAEECDEITKEIGLANLIKYTANPVFPGFTLPKIIWVRKNEPNIYEKISKVLLPKDYIRFCLTGEVATEVSDASGTSMLDVKNRKWSDEMLEKLNIPKDFLPKCYESDMITGGVSKKISELTGLKEGTPVVGGGGDQAAQAVGTGIVKEGVISATLGTSGVVFACCEKVRVDKLGRVHTFCHAVKDKWHVMGVMLSAGGSLRWFRDSIWHAPYDEMTSEAGKVEVGSEGLIFLPYLSGERTPHGDPYAKGVFFGLCLKHKKPHLTRAILEGVAFGMKDSLEIIKKMGIKIEKIRVSGGGAKSTVWRQIQADVYGMPVARVKVEEGAAYGAAIIAGVGVGIYSDIEEACNRIIEEVELTEPIEKNVERYKRYYELYVSLYPLLKESYRKISKI